MLNSTGRRPARGDDPEIYLKDALRVFVHSGRLARGKINIPFIFCRRFRKKSPWAINCVEGGNDGFSSLLFYFVLTLTSFCAERRCGTTIDHSKGVLLVISAYPSELRRKVCKKWTVQCEVGQKILPLSFGHFLSPKAPT